MATPLVMGYSHLLLYLLVSVVVSLKGCMGSDSGPIQMNDDVFGLIVFKADLIDPFSYLSSWNEDDDSPCSWKFIECNPVSGRVSQVSLDGLGLSGRLGKGLQKLQHLKTLSLSQNNFSGGISHELGFLSNLERLNLSHNSISGLIPSFLDNMSSIKFLDLSENSFSGPLPDNLFRNSQSLRYLSLAGNLLQGPIPSSLVSCSSLNTINLSNNHFSGDPDFSSGIWSLKRLRKLDLSHNEFSGSVPQGVSAIHFLKELQLQGNRFSGPLPGDIGLCPHLNRLDLSRNLFSGVLPESLRRLSSMSFFSLSKNMLAGEFPRWIGSLTNLEYLDLSSNALTGSIPSSIGDLKSLRYLSLSNNKLFGIIPTSVVSCTMLSVIRLRGNSFNGSIPEGLFDLGLEEVDFSDNGLVGSIPSGSITFFSSLHTLDLSKNNLTGHIPAERGLSSNLRYLNLSWNNLESRMPLELGYFQNLTVLDLRNSALVGFIPADICESGSLNILQLDGNSLVGQIPEEIGNCSSLYLLSLSQNNLSGSIPESISRLNKLKILKLEFNELTGEIPLELGKLENLLAVNVSYNKLEGRLPVGGIFPSLDQSALQGNLGICSPLLKGPCKMNVPKPLVLDPYAYGNQGDGKKPRNVSSHPARFHHHVFLSVSTIIAISAAILILFGVILVSLLNVSVRKRLAFVDHALESMCSSSSRSGNLSTGKLVLFDSKSSPDWISNPEALLNKAAEIGQGVFGTVYKVSLGSEARMVAIKKLFTLNITQYPEDFDREVQVLGKARHPNLLSLKGYYWTPQLQLLVSEYAPNGSLQAELHERIPSASRLSWANRLKIVLGTAKGLAHLHHSFRPPIIHFDIKPSNILLDENFNPKISDFGLARFFAKLDRHVISTRFQSALGYVAPELLCQSLIINEKCDVYGFGILILELVTGRRPVEYGEDNVLILKDHVRFLLEQGNVFDCVDPSMGDYPEDEVLPVLKLALVCTSHIPSSRPSMAEVVQILQVIKTPVPQRTEFF
ncbi:PREDICTED: probably inactive leucine-rich repeat receptor-like protein kinase At3g28040 [Populus euphratica]|uniref:Probably inactive leucine-rich repeat receptor-like protein kinase At3g28040 n=1 Tax=Populus euphratica TaxID=75702 RepID=A0AAJ6Y5E6_POPEU|nr:PREDICTED: probably inactive leucine-rich repeat receptor-like protein kinase At3g28040 [Populus euphratica]XP_011042760.1 PREDICTED: probably inactive leucine-rich repeat receptor-like protein kinase At3g28040 [Populus euphratica]